MTEAAKEKLFQYLQGRITFDDYQKEAGSCLTPGDTQPQAASEFTDGLTELPTTSYMATDEGGGDPKTNMVLDYLHGKISFEEFDNFLETPDPGDTYYVDESSGHVYELNTSEDVPEESSEPTTELPADDEEEGPARKPRRGRGRGPARRKLPKDLQGLMGEANLRFAHGEYDEAIKMCLEVVRLAPTSHEPFQTLGMLYEETGDREKALQYSLIGAHLNPRDAEEWARLAEMSVELGNTSQASMCLTKAIKNAPENTGLLWERAKLFKELGNMKKVIEDYELILQAVPPSDGEQYFLATRHLAETSHLAGYTDRSIECMEKAFQLCPNHVTSEYVNLLMELYLSQKEYETILEIVTKHCGVTFVRTGSKSTPIYAGCHIPDALPIDLRVKVIISLIFLSELDVVSAIAKPVYAEDVDEYGDLFLDIAEAFIEKDNNTEACYLLDRLVHSQKYNTAPAVWLKYADSLNAVGRFLEAADSYKKVVELVPTNYEARVSLSQVQQHLGQTEEALETLHNEDDTDEMVTDPCLLLHRCHLLISHQQYDEYYQCAKKLLFGHLQRILRLKSVLLLSIVPRTFKHRRDIMMKKFGLDYDRSVVYSEESNVSVNDLWEIFMKSCQLFTKLKQFDRLEEFSRSCQFVEAFMKDPVREREAQFITCYSCLRSENGKHAADIARIFVYEANVCNATWNFFNQALMVAEDNRHNKFVMRMFANDPNNLALQMMYGHCALLTSFYKRAVHDYFAALRQSPDDPLTNLCVGLSFLNIASQSYASKRHELVLQAVSFFNRYKEYRGECQEAYYNIGRAMHQLNILHAAVYYYQKVLSMEPIIKDNENFDLKKEAAYNLSLIYRKNGSDELASIIIEKYLVI